MPAPRVDPPLQSLRADVIRARGRFDVRNLAIGLLLERTLRPVVTLRLCQAAATIPVGAARIPAMAVCRALHRRATTRAGIDLRWTTSIGGGFRITHGWGLVVSEHARIGRNVTLFHGVTIGRKDAISEDGSRASSYPTIEDDVWVGPHAVIVGGVTVGAGSRVAAQTVVVDDVPPRAIVGGNPMRILRENAPLDVSKRVSFDDEG